MSARYSLSPTSLENFRRFRDDSMSADELRRRLLERYHENAIMAQGKAIHESLEKDAAPGEVLYGGYAVTVAGSETPLPGGRRIVAREDWLRYELDVPMQGAMVEMNARVDGRLDPPAILDYKTSQRPGPWTRWLLPSVQWRLYCVLDDVPAFVYRHFRFRVEPPLRTGRPPHIFTDRPEDLTLENDWTLDDVRELCAIAIATTKVLNVEEAIRSKPARKRQLRYLARLITDDRTRADTLDLTPSSSQLRALTVWQAGRAIDRMKGG